jgi:GNAT superfamily N-acetyltransferase
VGDVRKINELAKGGIRMRFKEFKAEDLAPASELFVTIFNGKPWEEGWTTRTAKKRLEEFLKLPNFVGLCCYEQEELLGFVLGNKEQWFTGSHFQLKEMGVKPTRQREGIGTKLMKQLRENLKQTEVEAIYLLTARGSQAEKFYRQNGFEVSDGMVVMGGEV